MKSADQELEGKGFEKSYAQCAYFTLNRQQSKMQILSRNVDEKIARNSDFDCHLSPVRQQMAIKNSISYYIYLHLSIALAFSIAAYPVCIWFTMSFPHLKTIDLPNIIKISQRLLRLTSGLK